METKISRRHSASDMKLIRTARKNLMDTMNLLVELGDDGEEIDAAETTAPVEPMKRRAVKNDEVYAMLTQLLERMLVVLQTGQETEMTDEEEYSETEDNEEIVKAAADRDTTMAERQDMPAEDFVFPDTRNFPVVTPSDIPAAVSSWGRYGGSETFETFKQNLIDLAKTKGQDFVDALPKEWLAEMQQKSIVDIGTMQISEEMKLLARRLLGEK